MWKRESALHHTDDVIKTEHAWIRDDQSGTLRFPMDVTIGKKTDMVSLKAAVLEHIREQVQTVRKSREALYLADELEQVVACNICGSPSTESVPRTKIYGALYQQCKKCSHVYVKDRPTEGALHAFYEKSTHYASTYTDRKVAEKRLDQIYRPWVVWMLETYARASGGRPSSILDIGAGGGHFVAACEREKIAANGIELSDDSRAFARELWNLELMAEDFCKAEVKAADVITFWGLLEHVPDPGQFLDAAKRALNPGRGMVIAKVPRWDSLSAGIQRQCRNTIIRHLDPLGHIQCFTDESMAELLHLHGFKPVAAWYYGMDVYETMMQTGLLSGVENIMSLTRQLQLELQAAVDAAIFSDQLVIAAVPV